MTEKDPSLDNLIDYIANGDGSGPAVSWATTALTVDLGSMPKGMMAAARFALDIWTETTGITFTEVSDGANISFGVRQPGAYTQYAYTAEGEIVAAEINVSRYWMDGFPADQRWGVGDYGLQTFVHELGHALGLQHPGPYNGTGTYEDDAIFAKDTWKWSVMSYFDQSADGSQRYGNFISAPGVADVAAFEELYGPIEMRTGKDVYTLESLLAMKGKGTYTFIDSGGMDTFDFRDASEGVHIRMQGGEFSTFGDYPYDFAIALGTTIEKAFGSKSSDILYGNDADNVLVGGKGYDALEGGAGADTLIGGDGDSRYKAGDAMRGGEGADLFIFRSASHFDKDVIYDFEHGVDVIDVSSIDANVRTKGNQAFDFIGTANFSGKAGEVRYIVTDYDYVMVTGDLNGDRAVDFSLSVSTRIPLTADDFIL